MKKNRALHGPLIIFTILFLVLLNESGCKEEESIAPTSTEVVYSTEAEKAFKVTISESLNNVTDIDLNSGITMEKAIPISPDTTTLNSVTFAVFNHTEESLMFPDQGFGLIIYRYDSGGRQWKEVPLPHTPNPSPKILSPKTEKWDLNILNIWDVPAADLKTIPYKRLRLFVHAIGEDTLISYGAYIDVMNPPYSSN